MHLKPANVHHRKLRYRVSGPRLRDGGGDMEGGVLVVCLPACVVCVKEEGSGEVK